MPLFGGMWVDIKNLEYTDIEYGATTPTTRRGTFTFFWNIKHRCVNFGCCNRMGVMSVGSNFFHEHFGKKQTAYIHKTVGQQARRGMRCLKHLWENYAKVTKMVDREYEVPRRRHA